ncbi:OX-2 membrane glycoprotein-like isoform X2 [Amphiprion ocellaris]|uniref:OX-2 membrane glycoprotein-like isoform X2 n=1 Tax=Amphiprion ocellaris TaxID=80972 RepID=UPI0024114759|nr:OX-2 membrane glycoprotein-like isoform X2 [Amphiprion ocellaris]
MADSAVLYLFAMFGIFSKGLTSVIQTQQIVVAAVGQEAHFNCQLLQPKQVLQVTWQKVLPDGETNLGTYNKFFGETVNPESADKMDFSYTGLQICSIVIRNVTEQDEGCYRCLFNTYPEGALTARTCLQLYELHEPVLHVGESDSAGESVLSCSATGRPAPTVTLNVTQQHLHFSHHDIVSVSNNNGTVTVTVTAVLSGFRGNSTQVGCAARVLSGPQMEAFVMIPEVKPSDDSTWIVVLVVVMVACCCVVAGVIFAVMKQKSKIRDLERNKTPQKPIQGDQGITTPFINQENEQLRQRSSVKKSPPNRNQKPSPSVAKRLEM